MYPVTEKFLTAIESSKAILHIRGTIRSASGALIVLDDSSLMVLTYITGSFDNAATTGMGQGLFGSRFYHTYIEMKCYRSGKTSLLISSDVFDTCFCDNLRNS